MLAIAAAGLAARLVYVLVLSRDLRGTGDSAFYHQLANLVADGRGFSDPIALGLDGEIRPTALHPPLFPLVLAAAAKLGVEGYLAHRVLVCLIGAAAIVAVGLLGRRVAGPRTGLAAAALAAAHPGLIAADGAVMSETLFGLLVAASLLAAYALADRPTGRRAAVLGAVVGLAALTRGEGLLLLPLLAVAALAGGGRRRLGPLAVACLAAAVVVAPWTVRNALVFEKPVLVSTNEGNLLAGANCPTTYAGREIGSWDIACVRGGAEDESVAASRYRRDGLAYARGHPGRLPAVVAARLGRTFSVVQPLRHARQAEGRAAWLETAGVFAFYVLAAAALVGALALRRRGERLAILLAPIVLVALVSALTYGVPRFRHPADISLVVLAGVAVARVGAPAGSLRPVAPWPDRPAPARRSPRRGPARAAGRRDPSG